MRNTKKFAALDTGKWHDFSVNKSPRCPHCGEYFNITDNEAWFLYDDNETHEVECPTCELGFQVNSVSSWCFNTDEQERDDA